MHVVLCIPEHGSLVHLSSFVIVCLLPAIIFAHGDNFAHVDVSTTLNSVGIAFVLSKLSIVHKHTHKVSYT